MTLWSRIRSLHWAWQVIIVVVLMYFYPLLYILVPILLFSILKEKTGSTRISAYAFLLIFCLFVAVFVGVTTHNASVEMQRSQQQVGSAPEQIPSEQAVPAPVEPLKTETAYDRIISIVGKYDEYPIISNLSDLNAKDPQPPYEVIIAMENVKSCFSAKDKALNIMRDLYLDPVTSPTIVRVKTIHNEYLSASLGSNDAHSISAELWNGNGATNFVKALQGGATYDMDDVQEATSKTASTYTFAELERGCQ
jgi:hypothetical protein